MIPVSQAIVSPELGFGEKQSQVPQYLEVVDNAQDGVAGRLATAKAAPEHSTWMKKVCVNSEDTISKKYC